MAFASVGFLDDFPDDAPDVACGDSVGGWLVGRLGFSGCRLLGLHVGVDVFVPDLLDLGCCEFRFGCGGVLEVVCHFVGEECLEGFPGLIDGGLVAPGFERVSE